MSEWARPDDHEIDVFATGTTLLLAPGDPDGHSPVADLVRRAAHDYHARPGHRPGVPIATTSGRRSGDCDVVRPVLVDPRRASAVAADGRLFDDEIDGLEFVASAHERADRDVLVWAARLSGAHVRSIPVSLHLLASPSMVVTIIELVPQRRLRWNRTGFLADGVAVVERIARRLAAVAP